MKYVAQDAHVHETFEADTREEALAAAKDWYADGDWGQQDSTTWIEFCFGEADEDGNLGEDYETITITLEPEEPECTADEHDWQSPHSIVGGIKENPGVWGNGGGVKISECCMNCGCQKLTDTWAQNPNNGEQGLTSVTYTPRHYQLPSDSE